MANTYTQLYIQSVFAVKYREALLNQEWRVRLLQYMTGIMRNLGHKVLAINGVEDHAHVFFGMNPEKSISQTLQILKCESSAWINDNHFCHKKFAWQGGYGAFSYSKRDISTICNYIANQEEHHRTIRFLEEYKTLLEEFDVPYDERYLFHAPV